MIVGLMLVEQHRGDLTGIPGESGGAVLAAAALAAGEPRRALRLLASAPPGDPLVAAATVLDVDRYPGDAGPVLEPDDLRRVESTAVPVTDPVSLMATAFRWIQAGRRVAEDARIAGSGSYLRPLLEPLEALYQTSLAHATTRIVSSYLLLAAADIARRAAVTSGMSEMLDAARTATVDAIGEAHLLMTEADWAVEPWSHPECWGLWLRMNHTPEPERPDLDRAERLYGRADALYSGSRGCAAIALRRAHLARRRGDHDARVRWLAEAGRLAAIGGEPRLVRLAELHTVLDLLAADEVVDPDRLDGMRDWAVAEGGSGFARGAARMLMAFGERYAGSAAGFRADRLAHRLAAGSQSPVEAELAIRSHAEQAYRINARSAAIVLDAAESARLSALARSAPDDAGAWNRSALAVLRVERDAEGLADPDFAAYAGRRLAECEAAGRGLPVLPQVLAGVREAVGRSQILCLRHAARRADNAGQPDEGLRLRRAALAAAHSDPLLKTVMLIENDNRDEATAHVDRLVRAGIWPDAAAALYLAAGKPHEAHRVLADVPEPVSGPVWEDLDQRAGAALGMGDPATATRYAARAIEAFEASSARLVRDHYRSSVADSGTVAGIYHTAVLAHLALAETVGAAERQRLIATAFGLADRCRSLVLDVVGRLDGLARQAQEDVVRRWLAAAGRLAATYERLAAELIAEKPAPTGPAEIMAAEEELDRAELRVAQVAPSVITVAELPAHPALDEVRSALGEDDALLLYQAYDEDLVIWSVRRHRVRVARRKRRFRDLMRAVRELHAVCADFRLDGSRAAELAGRVAADLIEPVGATLGGVRRLYLVPHAGLMLVPFAVLPLAGDLLGERFAISVLPAAALLTRPGAGRRPRLDRPALLVGDPVYDRYARLPGTGVEVAAIARRIGTADPLLGPDATARAVRDRSRGRDVVHLATHGFVDELRPHLGHLALAGSDRLDVPDLLGLDLDAGLLVLSACHTGRGRATAGGDVLGLARAAITAGARHLIVSLWPVDDVSACLIMTTMYDRLVNGHDVGSALACAQRRVRRLDAAGRAAAFERLRQVVGGTAAAGRTRDLTPDKGAGSSRAGVPAHWAPFIHIGA